MRIQGRRDPSALRRDMVETQIRRRGISDRRTLDAMLAVPRHEFVPEAIRRAAYDDRALAIGHGATISQPYIVALMTSSLRIDRPGLRVLEVGTGSGYQAAVLAECGCEVFTVERIPALFHRASETLRALGYGDRIRQRLGDGSRGWPREAPFDRMIVTAAAASVPPPLLEQTHPDGLLIAPIGDDRGQVIRCYRRREGEWRTTDIEGALFVPLIEDPPDVEE